jgi:hypothetical protein
MWNSFTEKLVPENMIYHDNSNDYAVVVGIVIISHLGAEIQVILVWLPPSWSSGFRIHQTALTTAPLESECSDKWE